MSDDKWELVVVRLAPKVTSPNYEGVWLECDSGRAGGLESWMPAFLTATDWAQFSETGEPLIQLSKLDRIASAISRILKEAEDGE